jgi:hypothetical protein
MENWRGKKFVETKNIELSVVNTYKKVNELFFKLEWLFNLFCKKLIYNFLNTIKWKDSS